ncbi:MAG: sodium-dependent bicarbonate transport family permease [Ardenticatenia bacterium]|nr:sodium-dependent bicarbonate transport family permease [Ardenticatenia bacterium]
MQWDLLQTNLLSPPILFFLLGLLAVWVRSDLDIQEALEKGLSLYLMMAIGLQGGHKLMAASPDANGIAALGLGVVAAFVLPFATFAVLRRRLAPDDAAGVAASYGSVSAVTFVTAAALLIASNIPYSGHMVAALALMESPALVSSLMLVAHRGERRSFGTLLHEALTNGAVLLLIGSLLIGALSGDRGWAMVAPFVEAPFRGLLCIFLLSMGLRAGRRMPELRTSGTFLTVFAVLAPLAQAALGILLAWLLDLRTGDALLMAVLFGSASYIAVPAALPQLLPKANPAFYVPPALAVTFPFNIALGIPLYLAVIEALGFKP